MELLGTCVANDYAFFLPLSPPSISIEIEAIFALKRAKHDNLGIGGELVFEC